jgi:hypothetical protein
MTHAEFEIARSAKRAAWKIVRHAGRKGADTERAAVEAELLPLVKHEDAAVRREVLWMLSEIGGNDSVEAIAAGVAALERIPGRKSLQALKKALETAPEDYRPAIAQSLRVRGEKVKGYPSQKLVPTRGTTVKPA